MNTSRFAVLAVAFGLSGCSALVPGFEKKPDEAAPPPATETVETTGSVSKMPWPKACEVYSATEDLPEFQLEKQDDLSCDWRKDIDNYLTVSLYQYLAFENSQAAKAEVSETEVGSRKAFEVRKETSAEGGCKIAVPVDGGHMSVYVLSADAGQSCELAKEIAGKIEPKLPGGK